MGEAAASNGACAKLESRNQKLLKLRYDNHGEENDVPYQEHAQELRFSTAVAYRGKAVDKKSGTLFSWQQFLAETPYIATTEERVKQGIFDAFEYKIEQ